MHRGKVISPEHFYEVVSSKSLRTSTRFLGETIMKIRATVSHPTKAAGTIEHIENGTGRVLIALGHAEEVKLPRRSSPDWLRERLEQSALAGPPDSQDVNPGFVEGVQWHIQDKKHPRGQVTIIRKEGFEVQFFTEPTKDMPANVVEKFHAFVNGDGAKYEAIEAARKNQQATELKERNARRW
jgi:hypothetical protein